MVGVDVCEVYDMYMCLYNIYSLNDSWLKVVNVVLLARPCLQS